MNYVRCAKCGEVIKQTDERCIYCNHKETNGLCVNCKYFCNVKNLNYVCGFNLCILNEKDYYKIGCVGFVKRISKNIINLNCLNDVENLIKKRPE